jgi:hypothetical protein
MDSLMIIWVDGSVIYRWNIIKSCYHQRHPQLQTLSDDDENEDDHDSRSKPDVCLL